MNLSFLTPEVFNAIIVANLVIGVVLMVGRFYRDMTRPLPKRSPRPTDETQPSR
jgi:hypothetical protein